MPTDTHPTPPAGRHPLSMAPYGPARDVARRETDVLTLRVAQAMRRFPKRPPEPTGRFTRTPKS